VATAVLLGLVVSPARADDAEEARIHFEKAQTAYQLGRFDEALREYEAAYRAMPEPAFLFNMAQAHRQQYRIDHDPEHLQKALTLYKSYLRESPEAQNRQTVTKLIEELKSLLSAVQEESNNRDRKKATLVLSGPGADGASVLVDGEAVGNIPMSTKVKPGAHQVTVKKEGFAPWSTTVKVEAGSQLDVPVMLQPEKEREPVAAAPPLYKKWWFWTIVGAAVAGGAGAGIYFGTRGDDVPSYPQIDLR
jgi:tetratricopeptide (TPR) repeat protein